MSAFQGVGLEGSAVFDFLIQILKGGACMFYSLCVLVEVEEWNFLTRTQVPVNLG